MSLAFWSNGTGLLPERDDANHKSFVDVFGTYNKEIASAYSLRTYDRPDLAQGSANTCVGNSVARALFINAQIDSGLIPSFPSRLFIYYNARRFDKLHRVDGGARISSAINALIQIGVPSEEYWPYSTSPLKVNRNPSWEAYSMGYAWRQGDFARLTGVDEVYKAIAMGHVPVVGIEIDQAFKDKQGRRVVTQIGRVTAGHAMAAIGWDDYGNIELDTNWGLGHRDGGCVWVDPKIIDNALSIFAVSEWRG